MLNIVEQKRWRILQLWDARFMAWLSMAWGRFDGSFQGFEGCFWFDLDVNCSWTVCFETSKEHWPSVWYERWISESCDLATSVRQTPWCNLRLLGTSHTWKSLRLNWKLALPAASVWFCTQIFATSRRKAQPVNMNSLKSVTQAQSWHSVSQEEFLTRWKMMLLPACQAFLVGLVQFQFDWLRCYPSFLFAKNLTKKPFNSFHEMDDKKSQLVKVSFTYH